MPPGLLAQASIEFQPMRDLLEAATHLAMAMDRPAFDCVYIALAAARGCDFVTADETLQRKALPAGLTTRIVLLNSIKGR